MIRRPSSTWIAAALTAALAATLAAAALPSAGILAAGCSRGGRGAGDADDGGALPWDVGSPDPEPRPGMVWIAPGVLIAGTPPDRLPRVADEEMAGEQVVMRGFYIDVFPYPNEVGAIPTTGITQAEAKELCETQSKRLCTELELERACKGPSNTAYEYGDSYKASVCATGVARALTPNGVNTSCQSGFGVHDLHGGVWSWTASEWKRDTSKLGLVTARGGNGVSGELIGRCANGRGIKPDVRRPDVGVRCCAGEPNTFEVMLEVTRGEPLKWQAPDGRIAPMLEKLAPPEVAQAARGGREEEQYTIERMWIWRPLGNEELYVGGGCARPLGRSKVCGLVIARMRQDAALALAFVPSEQWTPTIGETETPRELFLYGGDRGGAFRRRVSYAWGRIAVAEKERKRKHKGKREPSFD